MKKKLITAILIGATVLNLVACGAKGEDKNTATAKGGVSISVQVEEAWLPYYEKVKETVLSENQDANIEFITVGSFDHLDILESTDPTNKDVADIFVFPADKTESLVKNQTLAALDAKGMAERIGGFTNFEDGLSASFNMNGEYWAFPYNIETLVGFVNSENAKNAGIDITKNIEFTDLSYEQMLAIVHDAWFGVAFTNSVDFKLLAKDKYGNFVSDAVKDYSELTEEQQNLFEALFNYWNEHNINSTVLWDKDAAGGYLDSKFATGAENIIRIDGPWATANLTSIVGSEENLEVIPLSQITINGQPLKHWKSGWGIGANARIEEDEKKMELATEFIEELVNPENAVDLFNATGKILENVDPSVYDSLDDMSKKVINATYKSFETALDRPNFNGWNDAAQSWQNSLLSWASTKPKNAEEAYNQVKSSFEAVLANEKMK